MIRVAFHAINGVGLGHLVRAICLANEVRALGRDHEVLVLTNAGDVSMLEREGIDFVRVPPRLGEPHADPARVEASLDELEEEAVLFGALDAFAPHVVVFDTHAPLRVVRHATSIGARTVLVLRELRDEAMRSFARSAAALAFDRIVVPHEPGDVDLSPLVDAGAPVIEVGPVVRPIIHERARARGPRIVAVTGGGGQPVDARRYVRAVADAHVLARARIPALTTTIVTGPYGAAPRGTEHLPGLTIVRSPPDVGALLAEASLVISQAGYNAVAELRALEKPAILVPGHRKAEDQRARARRLRRVGAAVFARPEARSIADRIEALLETDGALRAMQEAHRRAPLVPKNREAALAALAPMWRPKGPVRKVVLVAHDFAPKLGGMETVARALAKGLLARGIDVRVYTTSRLGADSPAATGLPEGVVVPLFRPKPPPGRIDLWGDLEATIEAALRDAPDVVHLCHAGLGPWVPALRATLPAVITANVHGNDLLAPWVSHGGSEGEYRAARVAGLSAADAVICVSRFARGLARAQGVEESKLLSIENGVDGERFRPALPSRSPSRAPLAEAAPPLARRLGLGGDAEVLLTVSRLAPRKGHATVLRAVARLAPSRPRLVYVFTGASEAMIAELSAEARALGIADRVVSAGFVADDELPELYRLASAFVLLSETEADDDVEGFGIALLEAAATGVPSVASRSGGMPEAIVDGETGLLVAPGDPGAAATAIARLLDDVPFAARLGERARARALEAFSEARACDRLLDVWRIAERVSRSTEDTRLGLPGFEGTGAELARRARERRAAAREERAARRETFRAVVAKERAVRLRATGDGARLLPEALADCAAIGHRPILEVKLRRFVEKDFQEHALPLASEIEVAHAVPQERGRAEALLASLARLPPEAVSRVRTVRLFLTHEARESTALALRAVPEAHALRRFFSERGAVVVPPPELMRYLSDTPAGGPETGMIEPTNLCNLACPTCPTGTGKIPPLPPMTLERFDGVIAELAPKMRNLALWNYGEPLLNRELPAMIAHAKSAGVKVVKVSSNVHFLDGARGLALLRSGLDVLILSVDGASQATYETFRKDGDFEKVSASVAWLCAEKKRLGLAKPRIELQFIAMRHNEHELPEMRRLAREWGVDVLRVKTVGADDDATRDLVPAERLLSRYAADRETPNVRHSFCTMAWDHTVVNVDGSVTPCCYLRPDMGDEFVMGNVFEAPFTSIWRGERYRRFRERMLAGRASMPVCNKCRGGTHDLVAAVEEIRAS
ncbi:MAG: glycosyltransferase [Deltaproteobacteria bacterium]|nr:glycosyltransferase [Deltaproteobacteria bacterium]